MNPGTGRVKGEAKVETFVATTDSYAWGGYVRRI